MLIAGVVIAYFTGYKGIYISVNVSILLRKVLSHLKQEIDFIPVIVDG
jgi:hypothetical protein